MRIHLQGRGGATADDELFARVQKKLEKVGKQVSPLAELTIELREERDPAGDQVAEATLRLKGITLRACERSSDMGHSVKSREDPAPPFGALTVSHVVAYSEPPRPTNAQIVIEPIRPPRP